MEVNKVYVYLFKLQTETASEKKKDMKDQSSIYLKSKRKHIFQKKKHWK